jgi:ribosomal protein S18 acetylase RimI-like enzyme
LNIVVRKATDEDKEFLRSLNRKVYREVVVEQFGSWDDDQQNRYFEKKWEIAGYQIIEIASRRIGTIWIIDEPDHMRIRELQILPEFQGQGIGSELMKRELERAKARNLPVRLRVLKANRARLLYERLGFRVHHETETHLIMENALSDD